MKEFNSFDKIIQFIIDRFEDGIVHFLDIRINGSGKDLNHKAAHNEQYCDFSSQTPWTLKISWIKAWYDCAMKICSSNTLLNDKINWIRTFMSWNSYYKYHKNSIIKSLQQIKITVQNNDESVVKNLDSFTVFR